MSTRISKALSAPDKAVTKKSKPPALKLPKSEAACADLLYTIRVERLALQKQVDELAAREAILRDHFIETLPKSAATGIAGRIGRVTIEPKDIVMVEDWDKVYAYIVKDYTSRKRNKSDAFALMQRRIGDGMVKAMWENGEKLPGLKKGVVKTVSCVKA